jgi:formylglycine-generating enzyme required for sulfatase activity
MPDTTNNGKQVEFHAFFMSIRGRPTTTNGQRSRNLSKQRADYFPRKAFRVEGKQINFNNTMKKTMIPLCALLLVGAVSMMTVGAQAAKLAVLVIGLETDAASDAFATGIRYEFTQKGYEVVDNDAVKAKLATLRKNYKDGYTVDTVGLAAWGKENSIDFVQLVVENDCSVNVGTSSPVSGREQVMQVVSCGTEKYPSRGYYRTRFVPQDGILEDMVFVTGGVFQMGCISSRDSSCYSNETAHWVQVDNFYIGKYEVTQALWKEVMGDLPSSLKNNTSHLGDNKAVSYISYDAITNTTNGFLKKLNEKTGKNYRLPTEAEWEYAARGCKGGTCESYTYSGSNDIGAVAYYYTHGGPGPAAVGTKPPNALGLYDMSGNVWEWCSDRYDEYYGAGSTSALSNTTQTTPIVNPTGSNSSSIYLSHGGGWFSLSKYCRLAYRDPFSPSFNDGHSGFRLVLQ